MPNGNNDKAAPPPPPKVKAQVTFQLLDNGGINIAGPNDLTAFFYIIGEALKQIGLHVDHKQPSRIIQPPPGMVVKP